MFDPDKIETIKQVTFSGVSDYSIEHGDPATQPIGYMHIELDSGEKATLAVPILAALGIQLSFPVILEGAKRIKDDYQRRH